MKEFSHLVEAAQAGDSEAYAALVQRFQGMAYAIVSRYVRDHHLAQDVVQDAIIEAFVHLAQLKDPSAFPGWFRQIVFRQCTRLLRQPTLQSSSQLGVTLRDEFEQANERKARSDEAEERAGRASGMARWLQRIASTEAWELRGKRVSMGTADILSCRAWRENR